MHVAGKGRLFCQDIKHTLLNKQSVLRWTIGRGLVADRTGCTAPCCSIPALTAGFQLLIPENQAFTGS